MKYLLLGFGEHTKKTTKTQNKQMLTFLLLFSVLKINVHRNSLSFICIHTPRTKLIIFNITMRRAKRNNKKNEIKKKFFFLYCMYNPVWYIFN